MPTVVGEALNPHITKIEVAPTIPAGSTPLLSLSSGAVLTKLHLTRLANCGVGQSEIRVGFEGANTTDGAEYTLPQPVVTEDCESYTSGVSIDGLNGGTGWSGPWSSPGLQNVVTSAQAQDGVKSLQTGGAVAPVFGGANRPFQSLTGDGDIVSLYFRPTSINNGTQIRLDDPITGQCQVEFNFDGNIYQHKESGLFDTIGTWTPNVWYQIEFKFTFSTGKYSVRINGGAWTETNFMDGTPSQVNHIYLFPYLNWGEPGFDGPRYYDTFSFKTSKPRIQGLNGGSGWQSIWLERPSSNINSTKNYIDSTIKNTGNSSFLINGEAHRTFDYISTGIITLTASVYLDANNKEYTVQLGNGQTPAARARFKTDGTEEATGDSYLADTWYNITIVANLNTFTYTVDIGSGPSAPQAFLNLVPINQFEAFCTSVVPSQSSDPMYVDDIVINTGTSAILATLPINQPNLVKQLDEPLIASGQTLKMFTDAPITSNKSGALVKIAIYFDK